jgi:putative sterol carrier protein
MPTFPTQEWAQAMMEKLNTDAQYADIARNWEGDICFVIEPDGAISEQSYIYMDLWHGKCLNVVMNPDLTVLKPAFSLRAPYGNFVRILSGELHHAGDDDRKQVQGIWR